MAVRIVADSTSYIPADLVERYGIEVVPLSATLGGVTQAEPEIDTARFLQLMSDTREFPTTSQPTPGALAEAFERIVSAGDDAVGVFISADMSGTIGSAQTAADRVRESHPASRIEIVDSRSNSMEEGFAVLAAARAASEGGTLEDAVSAALATIDRTRWLFTVGTLDYLKMGGRIGSASALLATMLQIHPVLTVRNGKTDSVAKIRTFDKALGEIVRRFAQDIAEHGFDEAIVHDAGTGDAAARLAQMLGEAAGSEIPVLPLGPVVAAHVGPGSTGVVYKCLRPLHKNDEVSG